MRASQALVLAMFRRYGEMDDTQVYRYLKEEAEHDGRRPMSESGARTRRSELSKPNEDRLTELRIEYRADQPGSVTDAEVDAYARRRLLDEGVRGPLWASTVTRTLDSGREATVWEVVPQQAYTRWLGGK